MTSLMIVLLKNGIPVTAHKLRDVVTLNDGSKIEVVTPRWLFLECRRKRPKIRPYTSSYKAVKS